MYVTVLVRLYVTARLFEYLSLCMEIMKVLEKFIWYLYG